MLGFHIKGHTYSLTMILINERPCCILEDMTNGCNTAPTIPSDASPPISFIRVRHVREAMHDAFAWNEFPSQTDLTSLDEQEETTESHKRHRHVAVTPLNEVHDRRNDEEEGLMTIQITPPPIESLSSWNDIPCGLDGLEDSSHSSLAEMQPHSSVSHSDTWFFGNDSSASVDSWTARSTLASSSSFPSIRTNTKVRFAETMEVQEYPIIEGDHPLTPECGLTLDWNPTRTYTEPLPEYDEYSTRRRPVKLSLVERQEQLGYPMEDFLVQQQSPLSKRSASSLSLCQMR